MREDTLLAIKGPGRPAGFTPSLEHREKIRLANQRYADNDLEARARRDYLVHLIESGYTNQAAGVALGTTKSAVGKMLWRMEQRGVVINRPVPEVKAKPPKKPVQFRSWKPTPPQPRKHIEHPPMAPVTLWERTGCCFPTNDGSPFLFCNNELHFSTSYCLFHGNLMMRQE